MTITVSGELGSWGASGVPARCYGATGAMLPSPLLTFTHATSDAAGPC